MFNNVKPLRKETKQKVLDAAAKLNYQPNAIAQSFATGKSGNIGVIIPYLPKVHLLSTYYFSEILSGIGVKLGANNYNLLLMFQSPTDRMDYTQMFYSQKVDGCIILGSKDVPGEIEEIAKLHKLKLPYCLVNQTFSNHNFNTIDATHYEGSFETISFLFEKGYENIAFLNGPQEYSNSIERLKGYQDAFLKSGRSLNSKWIFQGNYSRTSGFEIAAEIGRILPELDAIFVANDRMAAGLMQGLSQLNYEVGRDYALVGYDDSDIARMLQPQLTSVRVPLFEMGKMAAEKMLDILMNGKNSSFHERLSVTLIERASTL